MSSRAKFCFALTIAVVAFVACRDITGPSNPGFALAYIQVPSYANVPIYDRPANPPVTLVVTTADARKQLAAYALAPSSVEDVRLSPDGRNIVYSACSLFVEQIGTGVVTQILAVPGGVPCVTEPSWSPDGTRIVYYNFADSTDWIVNVDGSNAHRLPVDSGSYKSGRSPVWSPDGQRIAFENNEGIGIINADGTGAHELTLPEQATIYVLPELAWSPDSRQLAMYRYPTVQSDSIWTSAIWVVNADGSAPRQLTPKLSGIGDFPPAWRPDGSKIVFVKASPDIENLWEVDVSTGAVAPLTAGTASLYEVAPHWVPWPLP
jgi:Tol biopolymer transport system component